jgi:hypothetical protein
VTDKAKVQLPGSSLPAELQIILRERILCSLLDVFYGVPEKSPLSSRCSIAFRKSNTRHYYVVLGLCFEFGIPFHVGLLDFHLARNSPLCTDCWKLS